MDSTVNVDCVMVEVQLQAKYDNIFCKKYPIEYRSIKRAKSDLACLRGLLRLKRASPCASNNTA